MQERNALDLDWKLVNTEDTEINSICANQYPMSINITTTNY